MTSAVNIRRDSLASVNSVITYDESELESFIEHTFKAYIYDPEYWIFPRLCFFDEMVVICAAESGDVNTRVLVVGRGNGA